MRSHLVLSNHGGVVTNERGVVVSAAFDSKESNRDLGPYTASSAFGLHFVNWSGWHRNGRYVLIPKWMVMTLTAASLAACAVWLWRRPAAA